MEIYLIGSLIALVVLAYFFYTKDAESRKVAKELTETLSETRSAIRELSSSFDSDVLSAQKFAADQDMIAEKAEEAREAALKLADEKFAETQTAIMLASKKRHALDLFTKL